jgi:hypothetical protein
MVLQTSNSQIIISNKQLRDTNLAFLDSLAFIVVDSIAGSQKYLRSCNELPSEHLKENKLLSIKPCLLVNHHSRLLKTTLAHIEGDRTRYSMKRVTYKSVDLERQPFDRTMGHINKRW